MCPRRHCLSLDLLENEELVLPAEAQQYSQKQSHMLSHMRGLTGADAEHVLLDPFFSTCRTEVPLTVSYFTHVPTLAAPGYFNCLR